MQKKITAFGEIVWDVFDDVKKLGGAPLNFAYYCSKRGADSLIVSALGDDENGKQALKIIRSHGLSDAGVSIDSTHPTGLVKVSLLESGIPNYDIARDSSWDYIAENRAIANRIASSDAFLFGSLVQRSQVSRKTLWSMIGNLRQDCLIVFDANLRQNYYDANILKKSISVADVLKINESELDIIADLFVERGAKDPCDSIFETFALKYLILTLGPDGYKIYSRGGKFQGAAVETEIVDTVGAGDSFTATFITDILSGKSVEESASDANSVAALVCSRRGAFCL